ncbi:CopG family transcriptional regulator, partial [Streptococcus pneumoniae]
IRQAFREKIKDMYDIKVADEVYNKWVECSKKSITHEETMRRFV